MQQFVRCLAVLNILLLCASAAGCITSSTGLFSGDPAGDQAAKDSVALAMAYLRSGDTARAKQPLSSALEHNPRSAPLNNAMALVYSVEQEFEISEHYYQKAIKYDPSFTAAYFNYGALLYGLERYAEAAEQYRIAAEDTVYLQRAVVFENLGATLLQLGQREAAREAFSRALTLNGDLSRSHLNLAEMYYDAQNFDASRKHFDRFAELSRHSPASLWLGIRLQRIFQDQDAIASYALQLRNMFPDSAEYGYYKDSM